MALTFEATFLKFEDKFRDEIDDGNVHTEDLRDFFRFFFEAGISYGAEREHSLWEKKINDFRENIWDLL